MKTLTHTTKKTFATVALLGVIALASMQASACNTPGWIAQKLCEAGVFSEDQARAADRVHAEMGQPLDRILETGMDMVYPGSGTARATMRNASFYSHRSRNYR